MKHLLSISIAIISLLTEAPVLADYRTTAHGVGADSTIQNGSRSTSALGGESTLVVKGENVPFYTRKIYLRFDLAGLTKPLTSAEIQLSTFGPGRLYPTLDTFSSVLNFYGLNDGYSGLDGVLSEDWDELSITWDNAPANNGSTIGTATGASLLGQMTIPSTVQAGDEVAFSTPELLSFLNADSDDMATLIITASVTAPHDLPGFASKEYEGPIYEPPTLRFTFDSSAEPSFTLPLYPNATYLQPANALEVLGSIVDARSVELTYGLPFQVTPGDYIRLQAVGDFDFATADDNLGGPFGNGTIGDVWGVFSRDGVLEPIDVEPNPLGPRVLASVPVTEADVIDVEADSSGLIPDQSHDFIIPSEMGSDPDGVVIRVPEGATHLFLGAADEVWSDNRDGDSENPADEENNYGVRITRIYEGRLVGDYNFDGVVNLADYTVWRDSLGETGIDPAADGDLDGDVDVDDYLVWRQGFGTVVDGQAQVSQSVPEPTTVILLGGSLLAFAGRRRLLRR